MTDDPRLLLISADCHAGPQNMADYRPYMDPAHRLAFDDYLALVRAFDGRNASERAHGGAPSRPGEDGLWNIATRQRELDADGIAAEIIYAQGSIPFGDYPAVSATNTEKVQFNPDAAETAAGARAYNRWLADFCSADLKRHLGIARLPIMDVAACVEEVRWAKEAGLGGGVFLPPLINEDFPKYNDPIYEPLWAACAETGMTLNLHGGANLLYGHGPEANALRLCEVDWFSRRALWYLIFAGVFERHPKLHLALAEQRTHWAGPLLREMDSIYLWNGNRHLHKTLPQKPRDYFRRNCFLGASFMSRLEVEVRDEPGVDKIMWGSDYPHQEGTWPWTNKALQWVFGGSNASNAEIRAMVGENAARCYHVDLDAARKQAERIGPTESFVRRPIDVGELPLFEDQMNSWAFRQVGPWH